MTDSNEIQNVKETRIQVLPNGKIKMTSKDAQDLFKEYRSDYWSRQILTIGLSGNRQALSAKMQLYEEYVSLEDNALKTQQHFIVMAKKKGYRLEAIQELWSDFVDIYQPDFVEWLKNKVNPPKPKEEDGFLTF